MIEQVALESLPEHKRAAHKIISACEGFVLIGFRAGPNGEKECQHKRFIRLDDDWPENILTEVSLLFNEVNVAAKRSRGMS